MKRKSRRSLKKRSVLTISRCVGPPSSASVRAASSSPSSRAAAVSAMPSIWSLISSFITEREPLISSAPSATFTTSRIAVSSTMGFAEIRNFPFTEDLRKTRWIESVLYLECILFNLSLAREKINHLFKTVDFSRSRRADEMEGLIERQKRDKALTRELGYDEETVEKYRNIALMHDIGKVGIPDSVLNKPGKLTEEEFALIKSHTSRGYEVLENIRSEQ
ncbi:MAG: HD domain-containing protein [Oscillibacter sp.]|nr:HD domain-containing protein [Oscillibacter sp.]